MWFSLNSNLTIVKRKGRLIKSERNNKGESLIVLREVPGLVKERVNSTLMRWVTLTLGSLTWVDNECFGRGTPINRLRRWRRILQETTETKNHWTRNRTDPLQRERHCPKERKNLYSLWAIDNWPMVGYESDQSIRLPINWTFLVTPTLSPLYLNIRDKIIKT